MKGALLYAFTLVIEQISVICRFLLVFAACGLFLSRNAAIAVGAAAALAPLLYSLLVLGGLPSGHVAVRRRLAGRRPEADEAEQILGVLDGLPGSDATRPRHIFVIDDLDLNACISGTALYANTGLLKTKYVAPVLAHELGHLRNADGRMGLALRALVVPGAFWLSGALHGIVILARKALVWAIAGVVGVLGLYGLVGMLRALISVFLVYVPHYAIIFALGGVGPRLLDFAWERYFIGRELGADAYAARRGQRLVSVELLLTFHVALADIVIPWSSRRTHPPLRQRVFELWRAAPPAEQRAIELMVRRAGYDAAQFLREPVVRQPWRGAQWAITACAALLIALLAYGAFAWLDASPRLPARQPVATPTTGPTPTLGF